jgi:hypothetical protein
MIKLMPWRSRVLRGPYRGNIIPGNCLDYVVIVPVHLTSSGDEVPYTP